MTNNDDMRTSAIQELSFEELDLIGGADQWTYDAMYDAMSKVREGAKYIAGKAKDAVEYVGDKVSGLLE